MPELNDDRLTKLEKAFDQHLRNNAANSQWFNVFRGSAVAFMVFFGIAIASLQIKTEFYSFKVPLTEILQALSAPAFASGVAAIVLVVRGHNR